MKAELASVKVQGTGSSHNTPDIATFSVTVREVEPTSKEAVVRANEKVAKVLDVLAANGATKQNIKTNRVQVNPSYDYKNGENVLRGQEATVSITVKLCKINPDGLALGKMIDEVVVIDNITVGGVNFDLEEQQKLFAKQKSRAGAFNDAKRKAEQYAQLSGLKLGRVHEIEETPAHHVLPMAFAYGGPPPVGAGQTQVEVGQYETETNVNITWTLV